jgi:hypothetical protein
MSSKLALLLKAKRPAAPAFTKESSGKPTKRFKHQHSGKHQQGYGQPDRQQQQQQQDGHHRQSGRHSAAAANGSRVAVELDDSDDEFEVPADQAYSTLLSLLSKQRGQQGAVLKQHQAQQEGLSDASQSESEDLSDEGNESEGSEQSEDHQQQGMRKQQQSWRQQQQQQEEERAEDGQDAGEGADAVDLLNGSSNGLGITAAAGGGMRSTWEEYMSTDLSEQQLASLRGGGPLQWQEAGEGQQGTTEGLWKRAK